MQKRHFVAVFFYLCGIVCVKGLVNWGVVFSNVDFGGHNFTFDAVMPLTSDTTSFFKFSSVYNPTYDEVLVIFERENTRQKIRVDMEGYPKENPTTIMAISLVNSPNQLLWNTNTQEYAYFFHKANDEVGGKLLNFEGLASASPITNLIPSEFSPEGWRLTSAALDSSRNIYFFTIRKDSFVYIYGLDSSLTNATIPWTPIDTLQPFGDWKAKYHPITDAYYFLGSVSNQFLRLVKIAGGSTTINLQKDFANTFVGFDFVPAKDGSIIVGYTQSDGSRTTIYAQKLLNETAKLLRPLATTTLTTLDVVMSDFGDSMLLSIGSLEGTFTLLKFPSTTFLPAKVLTSAASNNDPTSFLFTPVPSGLVFSLWMKTSGSNPSSSTTGTTGTTAALAPITTSPITPPTTGTTAAPIPLTTDASTTSYIPLNETTTGNTTTADTTTESGLSSSSIISIVVSVLAFCVCCSLCTFGFATFIRKNSPNRPIHMMNHEEGELPGDVRLEEFRSPYDDDSDESSSAEDSDREPSYREKQKEKEKDSEIVIELE